MKAASCARRDLLAVLRYDVDESLSYDAVSCDEEVDVLSAALVEELIMDGPDGSFCIRR